MKPLVFFTAYLLVGLASTAPAATESPGSDKLVINQEFYRDDLKIYTSEYDIVNILMPINGLNIEGDTDSSSSSSEENDNDHVTIFFVLADTQDGKRVDKGLYVRKEKVVTKLLDHGREAAAAQDDSKTAFFGAKDGIYKYNPSTNTAEKYGSIDDSIISIAKLGGNDALYILTEDHILYKVTEAGTKKEKVEEVVNAQKIMLDYSNNLYYYTNDKAVYVLSADGVVKKIEGLPEQRSYVNLLKPPFVLEVGTPVVVDNKAYIAYANGTSTLTEFEFEARPTASSVEGVLIQYHAYNKKIYEYSILSLLSANAMSELREYLEDKSDTISDIASRRKTD